MKMRNLFLVFSLTILASVSSFAQEAKTQPAPAVKADAKAEAKPEIKPQAKPVLPKADEIIDKYVVATGGEAAYKKLTSRAGKGTMEIPAAGLKGTTESFQKASNKTITRVTIPGFGEIIDAFDGTTAWTVSPAQGMRDKTGEELAQVKLDADFYSITNMKEIYPKREVTGTEKVGDIETFVVKLTDKEGIEDIWYFDAKTFLVVRMDTISITPEGKTPTKSYLSDYREVDGIKFPFTVKMEVPQATVIMTITEIKHNVAIDDAKFAKPKE